MNSDLHSCCLSEYACASGMPPHRGLLDSNREQWALETDGFWKGRNQL